jgi:hypothetical protein
MQVIAIEEGHDGLYVRKIGDTFDRPDDDLDLRIRKNGVDIHGRPLDADFHPISDWFEPVDEKDKKRVKKQQDEAREQLDALNSGAPIEAPRSKAKAKVESNAELV